METKTKSEKERRLDALEKLLGHVSTAKLEMMKTAILVPFAEGETVYWDDTATNGPIETVAEKIKANVYCFVNGKMRYMSANWIRTAEQMKGRKVTRKGGTSEVV